MKKVTRSQYNKISKELDAEFTKAKKRETLLYYEKCTKLWVYYNEKLKSYEVII